MSHPAKLIAILLAAVVAAPAAAEPNPDRCEDLCWKKLKLNLGDCAASFPNVEDPLRKSCGDAAMRGYERCLQRCAAAAPILLAAHLAFSVGAAGAPRREVFLLENPRLRGRFYITLLNGDGRSGGVGHVEVLLDREAVYESFDFASTIAAEIPVDLETGAHALAVQSGDGSPGTVSVFVSDRPLASREDLGD